MEKFQFGVEPVTCHAWNKDRTQIAVSLNSNEVKIYKKNGTKYECIHTLSEHTQRVTSIDWAPNSNKIVSCGTDRNAYVWTLNGNNTWKPSLVILRINRAATFVKWSPLENKFAVGSGARLVSVCYFEQENDWWVSKHIKKPIRSTVTCLDWHSNNILLATGSTDFKARVFSAYIKEIEDKPTATPWGKKMTFGILMAEFGQSSDGGWIHSVSFNKSGDLLAWVGHDSCVNIVNAVNEMKVTKLKTNFLPFLTVMWTGPQSLVTAGHDCELLLFRVDNSTNISFIKKLGEANKQTESKMSAMDMFRGMDKKASTAKDTTKSSVHQNSITCMSIHTGDKENTTKLTTSGNDGLMVTWNYKSLEAAAGDMKI